MRGKFRSRHTYGLLAVMLPFFFHILGNGRPLDTNRSGNFLKNTMTGLPIFALLCDCNHDRFSRGV